MIFASQTTRRADGFTLLELLVVIALISILLLLLIPVVNSSFERGRSANCQANLRQIGAATLLYVGDNKGMLPTQVRKGFKPPYYTELLMPYLPDAKVWLCPSLVRMKPPNESWRKGKYLLTLSSGWGGGWPSYGPNDKHTIRQEHPLPLASVPELARIYAFGEMFYKPWGQYHQYFMGCPQEYGTSDTSFAVHGENSNVLFLDGHVEAVDDTRMHETPTPGNDPWFHFGGQ